MNRFSPKRAFYIDAYRAGVAKSILEVLCGENYGLGKTKTSVRRPPDYDEDTQECPTLYKSRICKTNKATKQTKQLPMEINTIEFWDLHSPTKRSSDLQDKGFIYSHNKKWPTWTLRLPVRVKEAWGRGFKYLQVASNPLTGEIFFVLNKSNGIEIKHQSCNKNAVAISHKVLIQRLEAELDLPKDGGGILNFSDNLDRKDGYTFRVTKSNIRVFSFVFQN